MKRTLLVTAAVILGGIALGALGVFLYVSSIHNSSPVVEGLTIESPQDGMSINVKHIALSRLGYLVILRYDDAGQSADVIGVDLLPGGTTENYVTHPFAYYAANDPAYYVPKNGEELVVALYYDDGNHAFGEEDNALPVKDANGVVLAQRFEVRYPAQ